MNPTFECPRELELVETITAERWPDRSANELLEHVESCIVCSDLAIVASAIHDESEEAMREAHVPPSGAVWWRAQRRAQQEAARTASRTITFVQVATVAATTAVLLQQDWNRWLTRGWLAATDLLAPSVAQWSAPLIIGIAMCVMLAPVAIYYAVAE
jgi:predicted anti-sigma-YlaC factor YlaD